MFISQENIQHIFIAKTVNYKIHGQLFNIK